jgi:hypothetical protein
MRQDAAERLLDVIAGMQETSGAARIREEANAFLRAPEGIGTVLRVVTMDGKESRQEIACALLSAALDGARMAAENGSADGPRLLGLVEDAVRHLDATGALDAHGRIRLAQVYARAGLEPPPEAMLTPDLLESMTRQAAREMPDTGAMLAAVLGQCGQDALSAHAVLGEAMAALPPDVRAQFVLMIAGHTDAVAARIALYWLLDRAADVRLAAATALLSQANTGQIDGRCSALLPLVRKWLPAEPARAMVDAATKAMLRHGGALFHAPGWTVQRALATLPDGAGAQSIAALIQQGRRRAVAMLLFKQGHGVKDAFIQHFRSAREQQRYLDEIGGQISLLDMDPDFVAPALARALGDGLANDSLPPPGLIDIAEIWGGQALNPAPSDARSILGMIEAEEVIAPMNEADRERLIESEAALLALPHFESWFEDTAELGASLAQTRGKRVREADAWRYLETRRTWWARQAAICAVTLKASAGAGRTLWVSFAASARAMLDGRPLQGIPMMQHLVQMSLAVAGSRPGGEAEAAPRPEKPGELARLLAGTGISDAYLQGYLTGLAITPRGVSLEAWLGPLLGGIAISGDGRLRRVLDLVIMRANRIDAEAGDRARVAGWIAALDEVGLGEWVRGLAALREATRDAWPASALSPTDKRVLRELEAATKAGGTGDLRTILPAWIVARHACRR